jgi:hypothetical protein
MSKSPQEDQLPQADASSSEPLSDEQLEKVSGGSTVLEERPAPLTTANPRMIIDDGDAALIGKIGSGTPTGG